MYDTNNERARTADRLMAEHRDDIKAVLVFLGDVATHHGRPFAELVRVLDDDTMWRDTVMVEQHSAFELAVWLTLPSSVDLDPVLLTAFQRELRAAAHKAVGE